MDYLFTFTHTLLPLFLLAVRTHRPALLASVPGLARFCGIKCSSTKDNKDKLEVQSSDWPAGCWTLMLYYSIVEWLVWGWIVESIVLLLVTFIIKVLIALAPPQLESIGLILLKHTKYQLRGVGEKMQTKLAPSIVKGSVKLLKFLKANFTTDQYSALKDTITEYLASGNEVFKDITVPPPPKEYKHNGSQCDIIKPIPIKSSEPQANSFLNSSKVLPPSLLASLQTSHDSSVNNRNSAEMTRQNTWDSGSFGSNKAPPTTAASINLNKNEQMFAKMKRSSTLVDDGIAIQPVGTRIPQPTVILQKAIPSSNIKDPLLFNVNQSQIRSRLDLSVSEFSGLFEDHESKKLICSVQTVVEVGTGAHVSLHIYRTELYSNSHLIIKTLQNRVWEQHTLLEMVDMKSNTYLLRLANGPVPSRKIRFRGNFEPFKRYIAHK